ncbi:unnamed protein product [Effrenium voratum]|nr:unnamed protein product [Effrenium voratum]
MHLFQCWSVQESIARFWQFLRLQDDQLAMDGYVELNLLFQKALGEDFLLERAIDSAVGDWSEDVQPGQQAMTQEEFAMFLFELCTLWCGPHVSLHVYLLFLCTAASLEGDVERLPETFFELLNLQGEASMRLEGPAAGARGSTAATLAAWLRANVATEAQQAAVQHVQRQVFQLTHDARAAFLFQSEENPPGAQLLDLVKSSTQQLAKISKSTLPTVVDAPAKPGTRKVEVSPPEVSALALRSRARSQPPQGPWPEPKPAVEALPVGRLYDTELVQYQGRGLGLAGQQAVLTRRMPRSIVTASSAEGYYTRGCFSRLRTSQSSMGPSMSGPSQDLGAYDSQSQGFSLPSVPTTAPSKPPTAPGLFASEEVRRAASPAQEEPTEEYLWPEDEVIAFLESPALPPYKMPKRPPEVYRKQAEPHMKGQPSWQVFEAQKYQARRGLGGIEKDIHEGLHGLACILGGIEKDIHEGLHGQACILGHPPEARPPRGAAEALARAFVRVHAKRRLRQRMGKAPKPSQGRKLREYLDRAFAEEEIPGDASGEFLAKVQERRIQERARAEERAQARGESQLRKAPLGVRLAGGELLVTILKISAMRRSLCLGALATASGKVFFSETFGDGWESRWTPSEWKKSDGTQGTWKLSAGKWFSNEAEDQGIQTAEDSRFFGLAANFESFSNSGKELIIQYQAKYEKDIECGGGYVKVGPKLEDPTTFGDPTPYNIMFGPDKCGYTKRTHLIFSYKGKNVLKKTDLPYKQEGEGTSHVYRLTLKPDNTAKVEIDGEQVYDGSLKEDWEMLAAKEIKDPDDKKPSDWVDDSMMDDPEDKKPDGWVEEKRIVDANAKKPDDWDDEEDGEWEAPMIDNPEYKGEWTIKRISNPAYKGFWEAKKIANPEYVDDDSLYKYDDFGFIGFDLWQVKGNTIFDNVIITDDVAEADKFVAKWKALSEVEKAKKKEEDDKKAEEAKAAASSDSKDDDDDDVHQPMLIDPAAQSSEMPFRSTLCLGALATASGKVYFSETFGSGWESRWTPSEWKKSDGTQGTWKLSAGKWYGNEAEDQGVQTAEVKGNTIFDNVIITDDVAEADKFVAKWKALSEVEKAKKKEEDDKKAEEAKAAASSDSKDDDDDDDADSEAEAFNAGSRAFVMSAAAPRSGAWLAPQRQVAMHRVLLLGAVTSASGKVYFSETFGDGWESRWTPSEWKKSDGTQGTWQLSAGKWFGNEAEDKGVQTAEDSRFFGLAAGFDSFSNAGKELIIQYQAKYEKDIECGGGYVKVGPKLDDPKTFGDPTPYNVMFGPDKCGYTKRTHLIFSYKGKNVLKKTDLPYKQEGEGTSHVYRLILKPDNTAKVEIDGEQVYEGSLKEDWEMLAAKEIKDPDDKKPSDWVDDSMMDDPEDKKPDGWVEEKRIVDANAKKPDDWDDEEDGEWEAPMIDNPDYKGEWTIKRISNPAYKGFWEAKKIANPEYVDDDSLYKYDDFGFIGFDLWQVKGNTIFDNVIITDDVAEADKFVAKWKALSEVEKAKKKEEDDKKAEEAKAAASSDSKDDDDDDDADSED